MLTRGAYHLNSRPACSVFLSLEDAVCVCVCLCVCISVSSVVRCCVCGGVGVGGCVCGRMYVCSRVFSVLGSSVFCQSGRVCCFKEQLCGRHDGPAISSECQ